MIPLRCSIDAAPMGFEILKSKTQKSKQVKKKWVTNPAGGQDNSGREDIFYPHERSQAQGSRSRPRRMILGRHNWDIFPPPPSAGVNFPSPLIFFRFFVIYPFLSFSLFLPFGSRTDRFGNGPFSRTFLRRVREVRAPHHRGSTKAKSKERRAKRIATGF